MNSMLLQVLLLVAQSYSGPAPAKADVPYILQAGNLIPTEVTEAKENKTADGSTFTVAGANSPAKTPLVFPIFVMRAVKLAPEKLQVFQLESREGHREITFSHKSNPTAYTLTVKQLKGDLYRLEVDESLAPGEYSLTPSESNLAFCFAVF
jgi:hypothetical protein